MSAKAQVLPPSRPCHVTIVYPVPAGGAMVWLHYELQGKARTRQFADIPPALHAAVRLVQTHGETELRSINIRSDAGAVLVTRDEIIRLAGIVRL